MRHPSGRVRAASFASVPRRHAERRQGPSAAHFAVLLLLLLMAGAVFVAPSLAAGSMGGVIQNEFVVPVDNARVDVWRSPDGTSPYVWLGMDLSDAVGAYFVPTPGSGWYKVQFSDPLGRYVTEWWANKVGGGMEDADAVWLDEEQNARFVNAVLQNGGRAGGVVRAAGGGPLEGIRVDVFHWSDQQGDWIGTAECYSGADGAWSAGGLAPGQYRFHFRDTRQLPVYADQFWDHERFWDNARQEGVYGGWDVDWIDADLEVGAFVSGVVQDEWAGPIAGAVVTACAYNPNTDSWPGVRVATVDEFGQYTLGPLAPGDYRLWFQGGPAYLAEWWNDRRQDWEADPVPLAAGQHAVRNATLAQAGVISGHVTADGPGAVPLEDMAISLYRWNGWDWWGVEGGWWYTDADGFYSVGGLEAGLYRVQFIDPDGQWATEYYDNVPGWTGPAEVPVFGGVPTVIDASLARAGHIAGYVHDESANPLSGIDVTACIRVGEGENTSWDWVGGVQTDWTGYFDIPGLPAGVCQVGVSDPNGVYAEEVYEDGLNYGRGYDLVVEPDATTWAFPVMQVGGRLYGQVVGEDGAGLDSVQVSFNSWVQDGPEPDNGHWEWYSECWTDQNGDFSRSGLQARPTLVNFWDSNGQHLGEYFDDAQTEDQATPVGVHSGASRNLGRIELAVAGHIAGVVTASDAGPLENMEVNVARWRDDWGDWDFFAGAMTDGNGWYDIGDLAGGDYRVWFGDPNGAYSGEFYDNASDVWSAQDVTVTAGGMTYVDAALDPAAVIEGHVRDGLGNPLAGIEAILYFQEEWGEWAQFSNPDERVFTDAEGYYRMAGLPAQKYQLRLENGENPDPWAAEVFDGALVPGTGTDLDLAPGEMRTVDPVLDTGGSLAGRLLDDESFIPLSFAFPMEIWVWAWIPDAGPDGGSWQRYAGYSTGEDTNGYMHGPPLAPGEYRVDFDTWTGAYVYEAWQDQADLEHAAPVTIVAGETTDLGTILMQRSAMIFGHLTGPDGEPVAGVQVRQLELVDGVWEPFYSFESWSDGYYQLGNMVGGAYRIEFDGRGIGLSHEFWDGAASALSGTSIVLAPRQEVHGIDVQLAAAGTLEGTVRNADGDPIANAPVRLAIWDELAGRYAELDDDYSRTTTDGSGSWRLDWVSPGAYRVTAGPGGAQYGEASVDAVEVATEETTQVDLVLPVGASISGRVTDAAGDPMAAVGVTVATGSDEAGWHWEFTEAETDSNGVYTLAPLSPGNCLVVFGTPHEGSGFAGEFWDNRSTPEAADEITIAEGEVVTGIDAALGVEGDTQPPAAPEVAGADDDWHAQPVDLAFSAIDDVSGIEEFEYRVDGGAWRHGDHATIGAAADHSGDGVHDVEVRAVDFAGNPGATTGLQVKIDTAGPVVSDDDPGLWQLGPVTVQLSAVDAGCGGVDHIEYAPTADGPWQVGSSFVLETWKRGGGSGERTVWVRAIDDLGNASEPGPVVVRLDRRPPTTTHDSDGLPHAEDVTVHLTLSDQHSGPGFTCFSVDGGMWMVGDSITIPALQGGQNDGVHTIWFYSVDAVGNVEQSWRSCVVVIDALP